MNSYNVKVNEQTYQEEVHNTEESTTNIEKSCASICFEAIKAEYDYCVTRAEKLENKVYILLAACAFVFVLLTTQIEKTGEMKLPQNGHELFAKIIYIFLLILAVISNTGMLIKAINLLKSVRFERMDAGLILTMGLIDEKDATVVRFIGRLYVQQTARNNSILENGYTEFNKCADLFCVSAVALITLAIISIFLGL